MQKSILRRGNKRNFTQVSNSAIDNKKLSLQAKGLLVEMLSKPDDWVFYKSNILDWATNGRDSTNKAFKELEEAGYVETKQEHGELGKFTSLIITVYDEPFTDNRLLETRQRETSNWKTVNGKPATTNTNLTNTNTNTNNTNNKNTSSQPKADSESDLKNKFAEIWEIYPKRPRGNKKTSFTKYKKAIKDGVNHNDIKSGLNSYIQQLKSQGTDNKYIKNADTWFNQAGWEDEYTTQSSGTISNQDLTKAYGDWDF